MPGNSRESIRENWGEAAKNGEGERPTGVGRLNGGGSVRREADGLGGPVM